MKEMATVNVVIAVLATIGVVVLLVLFVYVVRQMFRQKGE
jgi:hypothetical protein